MKKTYEQSYMQIKDRDAQNHSTLGDVLLIIILIIVIFMAAAGYAGLILYP